MTERLLSHLICKCQVLYRPVFHTYFHLVSLLSIYTFCSFRKRYFLNQKKHPKQTTCAVHLRVHLTLHGPTLTFHFRLSQILSLNAGIRQCLLSFRHRSSGMVFIFFLSQKTSTKCFSLWMTPKDYSFPSLLLSCFHCNTSYLSL